MVWPKQLQYGNRYIQIKVVIDFVIGKSTMPWRMWMLIQDILNSLDDFQEVRIKHAYWKLNRVAYAVDSIGHS